MQRPTPLSTDETYHVFNRGAHKNRVFTSPGDYERFLLLLFLCNTTSAILMRDLFQKYRGRSSVEIFSNEKRLEKSLVSIFAYSLMPNHFHLVVQQRTDGGITQFMKKVCTAYSMYFNLKYKHSGVLFQGRFKSSHIDTEPYFRHIFAYVHLNPVELIEKEWEERGVRDKRKVRNFLNNYRYSSFYDYSVAERPEKELLALDDAPDFLRQHNDLEEMLADYSEGTEDLPPANTEDRPR